MGRTESSTAGAIHVHLSCNLYAKICTIVLQTVILPLIASVFYHDALLSPARSSGSCHKGLLSARVRWNKHGPASLSWTLLRQTGQRAKDRERESYSPLLSLSLSLYWPYYKTMVAHNAITSCPCSGLHQPLSSPLQVLQSADGAATMKVVHSFWTNPSKVKGQRKEKTQGITMYRLQRQSAPSMTYNKYNTAKWNKCRIKWVNKPKPFTDTKSMN